MVANNYADGVTFVSLAPVHDPALVMSAIARAFGLRSAAAIPASTN